MNEDFLARLLSAAAETPAVRVDPERVLRSGRRRRSGRAAGAVGLAGVLLAATVTGVGALTPDGSQPPPGSTDGATTPAPDATPLPADAPYGPVDVLAGVAEIDAEVGAIRLPLDGYNLSADEWDVVGTAQDTFLDGCFERAGYGEYFSPGDAPFLQDSASRRARESDRYGVWRVTDVRAHGYASALAMWGPPPDEESSGLPFSEEMAAASRGCFGAMLDAGLSWEPETATAAAPLGLPGVTDTPEGAPVVAEWEQCLQDNGVAPPIEDDSGVLVPSGVWNASFDEQVRIGLVDVQCKDEVDLVQRLGDVEAAYQLAYLERGREWVQQYAALQQRALRAAEEYLAQVAPDGATD